MYYLIKIQDQEMDHISLEPKTEPDQSSWAGTDFVLTDHFWSTESTASPRLAQKKKYPQQGTNFYNSVETMPKLSKDIL